MQREFVAHGRHSLAHMALKAANGDPLTALDAALTIVKLQRPGRVRTMRLREQRRQERNAA